MYLQHAKQIIQESLIFDEPIITYNLDKFLKDKSSIIVTGISGSGKTTFGKEISDKFSLKLFNEDEMNIIEDPLTNKKSWCYTVFHTIKDSDKFVYEGIRLLFLNRGCQALMDTFEKNNTAIIVLGTSSFKSAYRAEKRSSRFRPVRLLSRIIDDNPVFLKDKKKLKTKLLKRDNIKIFKNINDLKKYMDISNVSKSS